MPKTARVTDVGIGICCCGHKRCKTMIGHIITGSPTVITDSLPTARIGDIVLAACGHIGVMVTGSPTTIDDNSPECRLGDMFVGCFTGHIITGSPTTNTDG